MNLARKVQELEAEITKLRGQAEHDDLTGCLRREALARILDSRRRFGLLPHNMTLVIVDIDHFKKINDSHGHLIGDDVLKKVATHLLHQAPNGSLICRMGGEEFALLIPRSLTESFQWIENTRRALAETALRVGPNKDIKVTFSAGLAEWKSDDDLKVATKEADTALYASKKNGRNQSTRAWQYFN
ncbi:MAG: GGDEF domain-containing protein [Proteobacteria bacterium]|nr:GGDEF domain-containing protein [Pseudomonadota bacterium]